MVKKTQNDRILQFLKEGKRITPGIAMDMFGVMRLAARIADLRQLGYPIASRMKTATNRYMDTVRYKVYWLDGV